jgi:hypothetical protein
MRSLISKCCVISFALSHDGERLILHVSDRPLSYYKAHHVSAVKLMYAPTSTRSLKNVRNAIIDWSNVIARYKSNVFHYIVD